ncbi:MAG: alanine--tRNA ligase-related protein [Lachnobacterium sp.]|nr:alanine--tRNA ligase-related protein [Lachnobacterium sp.]
MEIAKTVRLYDQDAYATKFEAEVLACEEVEKKEKKVYQVWLDQTLFFPEEGGQSPDMGTIDGIKVLDVQIKDEVITHTLAAPLAVGTMVKGVVDWKHRFYNMQQHSGEHIFSGIVHNRFGYDNVGFHLSDSIVTMDFNGVITAEDIEEIETEVNQAIIENIPVEVSYPTKEELKVLEYRSKIEIEGQVRIVTIPGYDVCACCAPHVRRTGEIGMLKVMNVQSYKGGVRISILCGFRALEAFRQKADIITELMAQFSTNQEALVENVTKLKNTNQTMKNQLASAKQELMEYKVAAIPEDSENAILFESDLDTPVVRNVVNGLVEQFTGICAVFVGNDESGYQFIVGSKNKDCRAIAAALREKLSARGGGSDKMIQGSVAASQLQIEELLATL